MDEEAAGVMVHHNYNHIRLLWLYFEQDIQDYVSLVCSGFLANVSLVIQSCYDMFVKRYVLW